MATGHIKNWAKFQHYKDRCPPWIKLERTILDDYDFACLPLASKALAPLLWLLASESTDGEVRIDPEWLSFRLRWSIEDATAGVTPLIERGFVVVASDVLAACKQLAIPEREGEAEREEEKACASSADEAPTRSDPIPFQAIADAFNRTMENLPKVRELSAKRKTLIRRAWNESPQRRTMEFWNAYLEECAGDNFLNGTGPYKNGHENWRPDFDFLLKPDVVTRTFEKAMHRIEGQA